MRIAITGATGFLGRYIVRQLASSGNRLRNWLRRIAYQEHRIHDWQEGTALIEKAETRGTPDSILRK